MQADEFRALLEDYLVPMFAGTQLGGTTSSTARHSLSSYAGPCSILLKPSLAADYRIKLTRSQPFEAQEKRLVDLFIEEVENIGSLASAENHYVPELMSALPRRVLTHLLVKPNAQKTAEGVLRQLESLASQTYEGKQVVAAIGMTGSVGHGAISVDALWVEDFARVLSNGFDTMYVVGADGRAFGIESLPLDDIEPFAPNRLGSVARWTKANSNRAAFAL